MVKVSFGKVCSGMAGKAGHVDVRKGMAGYGAEGKENK